MKKHIAEELPARKHPQAALSNKPAFGGGGNKPEAGGDGGGGEKKAPPSGDKSKPGDGGGDSSEKKIRQAVYDIRYRARRENLPLRTAYSQYMQNSSMSEMEKAEVRNKLFGKEGTSSGGGGEEKGGGEGPSVKAENFEMFMKETASSAVANALYKVFVDKQPKITEEYIQELKKDFQKSTEAPEGKKFKIKVTDPQSEVTYVRYADRAKISQLRGRGLGVEMTEYGDAYEGEKENKKKEESTEASRDRSRAKKDYDGDGKIESGAKEHAGVVHNAIQRKRGLPADGKDTSNVKESYIGEVLGMANLPILDAGKYVNPDANQQQIDVLPPDKKNKVTVNPTNSLMAHNVLDGNVLHENGYSKFLNILQEKKMTAAKKAKEKKLKAKYDSSSMKANMQSQYGEEKGKKIYFAKIRKEAMKEECDDNQSKGSKNLDRDAIEERGMKTAMERIKNKFRSMGARRVMIAPDMT